MARSAIKNPTQLRCSAMIAAAASSRSRRSGSVRRDQPGFVGRLLLVHSAPQVAQRKPEPADLLAMRRPFFDDHPPDAVEQVTDSRVDFAPDQRADRGIIIKAARSALSSLFCLARLLPPRTRLRASSVPAS